MWIGTNAVENNLGTQGSTSMPFCDYTLLARNPRILPSGTSSAVLNQQEMPSYIDPSEPLHRVEYEFANFYENLGAPYYDQDMVLVSTGTFDFKIVYKNTGGGNTQTFVPRTSVSGTDTRTNVYIPAYPERGKMYLVIYATTVEITKLALVPDIFLAEYDAGQIFNSMWRNSVHGQTQGTRWMKAWRTDDGPMYNVGLDEGYFVGPNSITINHMTYGGSHLDERFVPPEAVLKHHSLNGGVCFMSLPVNVDDAYIIGLCALADSYGVTFYLELANEVWYDAGPDSCWDFALAAGLALFSGQITNESNNSIARQWTAYRSAQIFALIKSTMTTPALVKTGWSYQANWFGWLNTTLYAVPLWAASGLEAALLTDWLAGDYLEFYAGNLYFGHGELGAPDVATLHTNCLAAIDNRVGAYGSGLAGIRAHFAPKTIEGLAYEGGWGGYPSNATQLQLMRDYITDPLIGVAYTYLYDAAETAGCDGFFHYGDYGVPGGGYNGDWALAYAITQDMSETERGAATLNWMGTVTPPPPPDPDPDPGDPPGGGPGESDPFPFVPGSLKNKINTHRLKMYHVRLRKTDTTKRLYALYAPFHPDDPNYVVAPPPDPDPPTPDPLFGFHEMDVSEDANTAYTYTQDWIKYFNFTSGRDGQLRHVGYTSDGDVVAVGGGEFGSWDTAWDNEYVNTGGTTGNWAKPHRIVIYRLSHVDGSVVWATVIGSEDGYDRAYSVSVTDDFVYIAGRGSDEFYVTPEAAVTTFGGDAYPNNYYGPQDPVVIKVNVADGTLLQATYLPDPDGGLARCIDFTENGDILAATTRYNDAGTSVPSTSISLFKLDKDLETVVSSFSVNKIQHDGAGNPCVAVDRANQFIYFWCGMDEEPGFNLPSGGYDTVWPGGSDVRHGLLLKLDYMLNVVAGTYLDVGASMAIETNLLTISDGKPMVGGEISSSATPPVTPNAIQGTSGTGASQGFVCRFSADLSTVDYCSYIETGPSTVNFEIDGIEAGPDGRVAVGLRVESTDNWHTTGQDNSVLAEAAAYYIMKPTLAGGFALEHAGYVDLVDYGASRTIGWNPIESKFYAAGMSDGGALSGRAAFLAQYSMTLDGGGGSSGTPAVGNHVNFSSTNSTTLTASGMPTHDVGTRLFFAVFYDHAGVAIRAAGAPSLAGWTALAHGAGHGSAELYTGLTLYTRIASSNNESAPSITLNGDPSPDTYTTQGVIWAVENAATIEDVQLEQNTSAGAGTTDMPAANTANPDSHAFYILCNRRDDEQMASGATAMLDGSLDIDIVSPGAAASIYIGHEAIASAGAVAAHTVTCPLNDFRPTMITLVVSDA